jgi:cytochrome c553
MLSRLKRLAWLAGTALSLSLSLGTHAAEPGEPGAGLPGAGLPAAGDPVLGAKKFYTCYGCHGLENYKNAYPDYSVPKLRHQTASYLISALQEYRSGARPHATMHAQAISLSDQDMADIAAYLQGSEPIKPHTAVNGKAPVQVAACTACHGGTGTGTGEPISPTPPILAGQHEDYLEQALTAYRNGRRKNAVMGTMAQLLKTEDDVKAAAEYFAGQSSDLHTASIDSK